MVRLTDRPDITLDVYRGRKTTVQQQLQLSLSLFLCLSLPTSYTKYKVYKLRAIISFRLIQCILTNTFSLSLSLSLSLSSLSLCITAWRLSLPTSLSHTYSPPNVLPLSVYLMFLSRTTKKRHVEYVNSANSQQPAYPPVVTVLPYCIFYLRLLNK